MDKGYIIFIKELPAAKSYGCDVLIDTLHNAHLGHMIWQDSSIHPISGSHDALKPIAAQASSFEWDYQLFVPDQQRLETVKGLLLNLNFTICDVRPLLMNTAQTAI